VVGYMVALKQAAGGRRPGNVSQTTPWVVTYAWGAGLSSAAGMCNGGLCQLSSFFGPFWWWLAWQ